MASIPQMSDGERSTTMQHPMATKVDSTSHPAGSSESDNPSPLMVAIDEMVAAIPGKLQSVADASMKLAVEKPAEFLAWIADCATTGFPGFCNAAVLAAEFAEIPAEDNPIEYLVNDQIEFIRQKVSINLAGTGSLSASIFADMASPWMLKIRLVFAVAVLKGYDLADPLTRSLAYACLCGKSAEAVMESAGMISSNGERHITTLDHTAVNQQISAIVAKQFAARQTAKGAVRVGVQGIARLFRRIPVLDVIETVSDRIYEHVDVTDLVEVSDAAKRIFSGRNQLSGQRF